MTRIGTAPQTVSRRSILQAGGLLATGVFLSGCAGGFGGSTQSSTVQMMFWGEGNQNPKFLKAINLFKQGNPNIKVDTQYGPLNGYYDKLSNRLAGGNPPDVFQLHLPYLAQFVSRGTVLNLDQYASELGLRSFSDSIQPTVRLSGHYSYALMGAATQPAIVYDKSVLDRYQLQPPPPTWTLDDLREATNKVHQLSEGKYYGSSDWGGSPETLESFLRRYGKRLFSAEGKLGFGQDELSVWLQFWNDLRRAGACVPMTVTTAGTGFEANPVTTGKAAFTETATSRGLPALQSLTKDALRLLPYPRSTSSSQAGTNIIPNGWFAISKKSKNVEGAVELLKFLAGNEKAWKAMGLGRGVPLKKPLRTAIYGQLTAQEKQIVDNFNLIEGQRLAPLQPQPPGAGELLASTNSSLARANQSVGFGKATPQQAATQFFADAARVLK